MTTSTIEDSDAISNTLKAAQKTMTTYTVKFAVTGTDHDGYCSGECADDVNLKNNPWTFPPSSVVELNEANSKIRRTRTHKEEVIPPDTASESGSRSSSAALMESALASSRHWNNNADDVEIDDVVAAALTSPEGNVRSLSAVSNGRGAARDLKMSFRELDGMAFDFGDADNEIDTFSDDLTEVDAFISENEAKLDLLRGASDALQIILFGRGKSYRVISPDEAVAIGKHAHKVSTMMAHGAPFPRNAERLWLDFTNFTAEHMQSLSIAFGIHPLTIEDCLTDGREKFESFRRYTSVVITEMFYRPNTAIIGTAQTTVLVFASVTLSFRSVAHNASFLPVVYRLCHGENGGSIPSTNWVMYAIIDSIVGRFDNFTQQVVDEVLVLDDLVLRFDQNEQNDLLRRINLARRRLATLRATLTLKREMLDSLCKPSPLSSDSITSYLRDVLDECSAMLERLTVSFEVLNHLDGIYLTRLSLDVAQSGEEVNRIMKKFSAVATICLPLSTIAGMFGMNVQIPGQNNMPQNMTYDWFAGIMVFFCIGGTSVFIWFYRQGFW